MDTASTPHPDDQTLHAYSLGRLDAAAAGSVRAHLGVCPACRRRVAELSSDSSRDRLRDAGARPTPVTLVISTADRPALRDAGAAGPGPPPAGTLPAGLADHPDYEVLRELGRGGMGVVYLVRNHLMGRLEVLKVVVGGLIRHPEVLDRFLREIRSAARLHHPNIVTAYSALRLGDSLALAMEYVEGLDLARLVKASGPPPVANACYYVYQAALGLQHAHEHGMVHRDIKPANLILASSGNKAIVKVLDFGLAKVHSEGQVDPSLTRAGQMLGTPEYIAPEQIRNSQSADIRADIYSLGCTLYYLLSGGPPFGGTNLWDIYQAHFSMDASPLHGVRPGVPVELAALVAKMMAKEPGRRFQTPGEVAQALTPFFLIGHPGSAGSKPDISPAVPPRTEPARPVAARGPAQPPTATAPAPPPLPRNPAQPAPRSVQPAVERSPAPPPLPRNPAPTTSPRTVLDGLIDLGEPEPPSGGSSVTLRPPTAHQPNRFKPRAWWAAAAVLVLGLVALWAAFRPTSPSGRTMDPSITNTTGMKFALIPAGSFVMGSPAKDALPGEKRAHREWIAGPFYLGIHEVTRGQFRRFVMETGHTTDAEKDGHGGWGCDEKAGTHAQNPRYTWLDPGFHQTDEHPVVNVSWNDAVAFAAWLSRKEGKHYRLPTEAEWEYACRAGSTGRYWFGDNPEGLAAAGNTSDGTAREKYPDWPGITARDGYVHTAPAGRFQPNPFGLYDMHGNVWEWCSDEYDDGYYALTPEDDPPTTSRPRARGVRGGSWEDEPRRCRSSAALRHLRVDRSFSIGFRLVLVPP